MLFSASTLLNVLIPLASLASVDARASHGSRRSHAAIARRNANVNSAKDLYMSAAHEARGENPNPKPARKRSTCSTEGGSSASASAAASSSSSVASAASSQASASAASSTASPLDSIASVADAALSSAAAIATSAVNLNVNVEALTSAVAGTSASASAAASSASASSTSDWKLDYSATGTSFFDAWNVWNYADPTHGTVDYVSASDAWNQGLMSYNSAGNAVMKVDQTQVVSGGRKSVRLHSKYTFNGGLVILDAVHMPTGCGTWPAFWSNGPNWPNGGEIDIVEGVNGFTQNMMSLHTSDGCTIPKDYGATATLTTGSFDSYNCASYATANQGCGMRSSQANNYGAPFNTNGGGVYAMKWDNTGISVYFFPRESIPDDITNGSPDPSTWGTPMANYPSTSCDPYKFFTDNFAILNTTFCGDWAGNVWNQAGYAGQSKSCAAQTGYSTCAEYVLNNGNAMDQAYWEVKSVNFYQKK